MSEPERAAVVIEDDAEISALLVTLLQQSGFAVTPAGTGAAGLSAVRSGAPDLVTLDLNLPDLDGIEVCRRIRESSDAYVIMLSARPDEVDRLVGLETGADDYLTKPFSPRELRARVNAMLRRPRRPSVPALSTPPSGESGQPFVLGSLRLDPDSRIVTLDGRELELTRTEFDLLATLLGAAHRVWARDALLRAVWGNDWIGDGHLVEVHMGNLRRKLGDDPRNGRFIRTVRGVGYRLGSG
jgi:two-component system OmpR family response regulator